jgi:hydrogenase maturation protease
MAPDFIPLTMRKPLTIIGLGNELLSDDGAGIRVVRELKKRLPENDVAFEELSVGGLQLLDYITGFERCIIVDAVATGVRPAGTAYRFVQTPDSEPVTLTSSHQIDLGQVLALAKLLGTDVPQKVIVYGIEAGDVTTFQESCTNGVSKAIPKLVDTICRDLVDNGACCTRTGEWQIVSDAVQD